MKVILLQDVRGVGRKYDVKDVSDGYARNFLLPRNLAKVATSESLNNLKAKIEDNEKQISAIKDKLLNLQESLKHNPLVFKLKLGQKSKVFGSVSKKDVEEKLKELDKGLEFEVLTAQPIKTLGDHEVEISLGRGVTGEIKVRVEKEA